MNKIVRLVISSTLLVIFCIGVYLSELKDRPCENEKELRKLQIYGKVIRVFVDSANHATSVMDYNMNGEVRHSNIFNADLSGCFSYLSEGDSILKLPNSLVMNVYRQGVEKRFTLDYGCKKD